MTDKRYGNAASPFGFEDLDVYKVARQFRHSVFKLIKSLPQEERFALAQQMRRACVSITSNIAEGYGRHNWQENTQFCRHARGSLMEIIDQINACDDEGLVDGKETETLRNEAGNVLRLLNGYIAYLQKQKLKELKE